MFDTYQRLERVIHHTNETTVKEIRAPTDESVRLLKEMELAAKNMITNSIRTDNTIFDCVIHSSDDFLNCGTRYKAIFKINGKTHSVECLIMDDSAHKKNALDVLHRMVSEKIAEEILPAFLPLKKLTEDVS